MSVLDELVQPPKSPVWKSVFYVIGQSLASHVVQLRVIRLRSWSRVSSLRDSCVASN